ncbi:conserved exported hypothetical protein [Thiocapsa sp. KS1]|nr:hypothetical protein [Thiocapsa sp. KS1]CRI63934.1 conserved exported hypothetical protein [Thiocapsa sp. KS1]
MSHKVRLIFALYSMLFLGNAFAGPFGLDMGMSLKGLDEPEKLGHGKYKIANPPKPHSAFEAYIVQVAPESGLCWIKAIGKNIRTSSYGFELQSAFNEMKGRLSGVYGEHETTDLLFPGSIWDEPDDWMMGLVKKERMLGAAWGAAKGSKLPPDIESVFLAAMPASGDAGYIIVEYSFANEPSCEAELAAQEDDAL